MDGVINVLKPPGMTSHDVVAYLRKTLNTKKVGHTGTLDPEAVGVLPVCVGKATRIAEYLTATEKVYRAELILGIKTNTLDIWGEVIEKNKVCFCPSKKEIEMILNNFIGEIEQIPPMFSAIKIGGKNLYELARQGQEIERVPRKITINDIKLINYIPGEYPQIIIDVKCSKGTYVRTLCSDIGDALGYGGTMSFLLRKVSGSFKIDESYTLEEIALYKQRCFSSINNALKDWPSYSILNLQEQEDIYNGKKIKLEKFDTSFFGKEQLIKIISQDDKVLAIGNIEIRNKEVYFKPKKVFKD